MNAHTTTRIGILHPGAMGISVAATLRNGGHTVTWASEGRSTHTRDRAAAHDLTDAETLAALCAQSTVIVSVCPPHAAEDVADAVIAHGFTGTYLDANAIAPQKALRIGEKLGAAGIAFVDGGIIGGPAWEPGRTWLYLSGPTAQAIGDLFRAGPLETEIIGPEIGKASALKMVFAARTKGTTALLCAVLAAAEKLGVRDALEADWARRDPDLVAQTQSSVQRVTAKAWRFAGEMQEIAATFEAAGLPGDFHRAAHEVYARIAAFKDAPDLPDLLDVLAALVDAGGDQPSDV
jgi:3-hydroxyisobutyrate dehydrogenase-like beta-hydroxyacid dehydrogenase